MNGLAVAGLIVNVFHIALGCINGVIDRQPQANVFFDKHVDWMPIDKSLKQVDG